jgi:hypothetical protein
MSNLEWLGAGATCADCGLQFADCACGGSGAVEGTARESQERTQDNMGKVVKLKETEEVDLVHGIEARALDRESIDDAIEKLNLKVAKKSTVTERVAALKEAFGLMTADDLSGPCTKCGQVSSVALDVCPFCGTGEEDAEPVLAEPETTPDAPAPEPEPVKTESEPPPKTGKRPKPPKAELAVVEAQAEVVRGGTTEDLDARVGEIRRMNREAVASVHHLAVKLVELDKSELWKLRIANGKVAYTKFEEFIRSELDMTREYGLLLMRCAENFSEKDFAEIGVTKLRVVLQFPKEEQKKMLGKARDGAGRRELEREQKRKVKQLKGKDKSQRGKVAPTNAITVAQVEGKHTIKLHARPAHRGEDPRPARQLGDQPFGVWDLANDVRVYISILKNTAGELVAKIEVKRITPEA